MAKKDYSIKPRFIKDPKKWHDRCDTLIHYMFEHLCQFVEHEMKNIRWFDTEEEKAHMYDGVNDASQKKFIKKTAEEHQKAHVEILFLYTWWTEARPAYIDSSPFTTKFYKKNPNINPRDYWGGNGINKKIDAPYIEFGKAVLKDYDFEQECEKLDKEMMVRLVNIKQYLWS